MQALWSTVALLAKVIVTLPKPAVPFDGATVTAAAGLVAAAVAPAPAVARTVLHGPSGLDTAPARSVAIETLVVALPFVAVTGTDTLPPGTRPVMALVGASVTADTDAAEVALPEPEPVPVQYA